MPKPNRRSIGGRATAKDRNATSKKNVWTIPQRIAVISAVISFFGGVVPAAFANWDRIFPTQKRNLEEVTVRITLLEDRQAAWLESTEIAERKIEEGMRVLRASEQLSPAEKEATSKVAEELKAMVRTYTPEVQRIFERSQEALKSGNSVEADLLQKQLLQKLLDLQRKFDQTIERTPLKTVMPDVNFKCRQERAKRPMDWAETPSSIRGLS